MAKTLVKTTQELVNFAQNYRIETEGKSIQEIGQELTDKLMTYYDEYYMYIDNGKQMKEAQERNREIEEEVAAIKKVVTEFKDDAHALLESMDDVAQETIETKTCATCKWNGQNCLSCQSCGEDGISSWEPIVETEKEESVMTENKATTNNNTVQEGVTMKTKTTFAERILNMGRIDRILYVYDALRTATKNTDEAFIKKDDLAKFMYDNDLIGRQLSKTEVNKTKRDELVELFNTAVDNLIKSGVIKPLKTMTVEEAEEAIEAIEKTHNAEFELIKTTCEGAIGHKADSKEFYLAVIQLFTQVNELRKQAAAEIDHAKVNTVNEAPKAEPKTENKPAMPINQANVAKESEVLPNSVAETVSTEFSAIDRHIFYGTNRMNGLLYYAAKNTENKHIVSAYMVLSVSLEYVSGKSYNKWKEIIEADKEGKHKEAYKIAVEKAMKLRDEIVSKYLTVYSKCGDNIKSYSINNLEVYKYSSGKLEQHYLAFAPGGEFVYLVPNEKGYLKANKKAMTPENMEKMKRTCSLVAFGGNQ